MAQQTISVGASANDGTGDTIRDAFTKSNSNFTELYTLVSGASLVEDDLAPSLGGNLNVAGFQIVSESNGNISIVPNGTGLLLLSDLVLDGNSFTTPVTDQDISFTTIGTGKTNINAVNITGGTINNVNLGSITPGPAAVLNLYSNDHGPNAPSTYNMGTGINKWLAGHFNTVNADSLVLTNKQSMTASGAISLSKSYVEFDTTAGAIAATLANGTEGQVLMLILTVDGGSDVTVTPTTALGYANIVLGDVGDVAMIMYTSAGWVAISEIGTSLATGGFTGSVGFTGSTGVGFAGSLGYTGSEGALGYTGSEGVGFTGSEGVGFTGSLGYTGSEGPQGPQGP